MSKKINIDFGVYSDLKHLKVYDLSEWGLIGKKPSIIEVTLPGYSKYRTFYFDKNKTNVFNSITLSSTCTDCSEEVLQPLPDGIYLITVKGSPSTFIQAKKFLKTDILQMDLDAIIIDSYNSSNTKELITDKLIEIEFIIKSAEAHLRADMEQECSMLYQHARLLVDKLKLCKTCN